jgi:hypothetical protein
VVTRDRMQRHRLEQGSRVIAGDVAEGGTTHPRGIPSSYEGGRCEERNGVFSEVGQIVLGGEFENLKGVTLPIRSRSKYLHSSSHDEVRKAIELVSRSSLRNIPQRDPLHLVSRGWSTVEKVEQLREGFRIGFEMNGLVASSRQLFRVFGHGSEESTDS